MSHTKNHCFKVTAGGELFKVSTPEEVEALLNFYSEVEYCENKGRHRLFIDNKESSYLGLGNVKRIRVYNPSRDPFDRYSVGILKPRLSSNRYYFPSDTLTASRDFFNRVISKSFSYVSPNCERIEDIAKSC